MRLDPVIGPIVPSFGGFLNPGAVAGGGFHGLRMSSQGPREVPWYFPMVPWSLWIVPGTALQCLG